MNKTNRVGTLTYHAPELALGSTNYSYQVDNWAVGCVMAEMYLNTNLINPKSENDLILTIFRIFGTPNEGSWPGISELPKWNKDFPYYRPNINPIYDIPVIRGLLKLDPLKRSTALEALNSDYFKNVNLTRFPAPKIYQPECEEILMLRSDNVPNKIHGNITVNYRQQLLTLLYQFAIKYKIRERTFFLTIYIIDKFVELSSTANRSNYTLIGIASLCLARQFDEGIYFDYERLAKEMDNKFSAKDILDTTEKIWTQLDHNLIVSLPYDFLIFYTNSNPKEGAVTILLGLLMRSEYVLNIQIAHATNENLVIAFMIALNNFLKSSEPKGCFKITNYHRQLAEELSFLFTDIKKK